MGESERRARVNPCGTRHPQDGTWRGGYPCTLERGHAGAHGHSFNGPGGLLAIVWVYSAEQCCPACAQVPHARHNHGPACVEPAPTP